MNRRVVGQVMTVVGAVAVVVGIIGVASQGDGNSDAAGPSSARPSTTTSPAVSEASGEPATTTTAATSTAADEPSARERVAAFTAVLDAAHAEGDDGTLFERLHPIVLERYGADQCRAYLSSVTGSLSDTEVLEVEGPTTIEFATDGIAAQVPDGYNVEATFKVGDTARTAEIHFAEVDGELAWFTDCGVPA